MTHNYFVMVFITIASIMTMLTHFFENETLSRKSKNEFRTIALLIITGVLCECISICLDDSSLDLRYVHGLIKAVEFSIAPIIPITYVKIIKVKENSQITARILTAIILFNTVCELISIFIPFIFFIDERNIYRHGSFYWFYILMYTSVNIYFVIYLFSYTKKY